MCLFRTKKTGKAPIPVKEEVLEEVDSEAVDEPEIVITETFQEEQKNINSEL